MAAEIINIKGQLKLNHQLAQLAGGGDDKGDGGKKKGKAKNKKDTSNKKTQKKDKAWKKVPPKDGKPKQMNMVISPSIGARTTWRGLSTSQLTANLARKGRRNRNCSRALRDCHSFRCRHRQPTFCSPACHSWQQGRRMMVRAGMDYNNNHVSIHGRDSRTQHRAIFDLPVRCFTTIHHPFIDLSCHSPRPYRAQDLHEGFLSRATLGSLGDLPTSATQED